VGGRAAAGSVRRDPALASATWTAGDTWPGRERERVSTCVCVRRPARRGLWTMRAAALSSDARRTACRCRGGFHHLLCTLPLHRTALRVKRRPMVNRRQSTPAHSDPSPPNPGYNAARIQGTSAKCHKKILQFLIKNHSWLSCVF
jgi:hypothetical protein